MTKRHDHDWIFRVVVDDDAPGAPEMNRAAYAALVQLGNIVIQHEILQQLAAKGHAYSRQKLAELCGRKPS